MNAHQVTRDFEKAICDYTNAPYCVTTDNCSNALFLALKYDKIEGKEIIIPSHTYISVPCEIINAGGKVIFVNNDEYLTGAYPLQGSNVWDSSLRFTADMYLPGTLMCLSFTGPYKHLKLGKGGAILTDSHEVYLWLKRARYSGRHECSYFDDYFDMTGWNFYMNPMIASLGLLLMEQFYDHEHKKISMPDIKKRYPDLSLHPAYK